MLEKLWENHIMRRFVDVLPFISALNWAIHPPHCNNMVEWMVVHYTHNIGYSFLHRHSICTISTCVHREKYKWMNNSNWILPFYSSPRRQYSSAPTTHQPVDACPLKWQAKSHVSTWVLWYFIVFKNNNNNKV